MFETFSNIVDRVGKNVGISDSSYDTKIKNWINEAYEDAWRFFLWPETIFRDTITTVANQDFVTAPPRCAQILLLSEQATPGWMEFENSAQFVKRFYDSLTSTDTGTPRTWTYDGKVPILKQPSSASVVTVVSSSGSDLSQTVRVWGRDGNGTLITESIQLNGTTPAAGSVSFTVIEKLSKSSNNTVGTITATSNSGAVTLARIAPEYVQSVFKIRLHVIPDSAISLYLLGKEHVNPLVFDEDIPKFDCCEALIEGATARALREQGDNTNATDHIQSAGAILRRQRDEILGQADNNFRFVPYIPRRSQIRGY